MQLGRTVHCIVIAFKDWTKEAFLSNPKGKRKEKKQIFPISWSVQGSWTWNRLTCASDVQERVMCPPFMLPGCSHPWYTWKNPCHQQNNILTNKPGPTHLEVAEDAVFLGSVQSAGRRSRELCTATHQEITGGGVTGARFAFIVGFHVTEQPLNTTDTLHTRQSKGSKGLKEATS